MKARLVVVPLLAALVHFGICYAIDSGMVQSEGGWKWFIPFVLDLPLSLVFTVFKGVSPLLLFGVVGSLWWAGLVYWFMRSRSRAVTARG